MRRTLVRLTAASAMVALTTPAIAFVTAIDDLLIKRDGSTYFHDSFGDGVLPPVVEANTGVCGAVAPNCYSVFGTFPVGAEAGGKLQLDTAFGGPSTNAVGTAVVSQRVRLLTNRSDASGDAQAGLKIGRTFSASAVFDLAVPAAGDSFTLRFEDTHVNDPEPGSRNDYLQIQVRMSTDAGAVPLIELRKQNFADGIITTIDSTPLDLGLVANQIRLTLDHPTANSNDVFGSWEYLLNNAVVGSGSFATPGTIFTGETWTRVDFLISAVPEPQTYAMLLAGLGLLGWRQRLSARVMRAGPVSA